MHPGRIVAGLSALALTGGLALSSLAGSPSAIAATSDGFEEIEPYYCSGNINYEPFWGVYNRQGLTNNTNPSPLWFYQDHKVGPHAAKSGGNWTTGGKGKSYCGNDFWYSVNGNL